MQYIAHAAFRTARIAHGGGTETHGDNGAGAIKNVVLVHGAFADGSGWRGVYENLTARGHGVTIVQNPLTSLEDDVAATTRVLDLQDGPTILVGHSWGGTVITEAGNHPRSSVWCTCPRWPRTAARTASKQYEGFAATPEFVIDVGADGFGFLNRDKFKIGFAADASDADAAFLRDSPGSDQHGGLRHPREARCVAGQAGMGGHRYGGQLLRPGDAAAHGHARRRGDHLRSGKPRPVPDPGRVVADVIHTAAQNAIRTTRTAEIDASPTLSPSPSPLASAS